MRLMIVDDHPGVRKIIREMIGHRSAEIRECSDGEEALAAAAELPPDYVIMDLQMPGMGGFEAIRQLVAQNPRVRIIAVSHLKQPEVEQLARRCGACHFIRKENLFDLVRYLGRVAVA